MSALPAMSAGMDLDRRGDSLSGKGSLSDRQKGESLADRSSMLCVRDVKASD